MTQHSRIVGARGGGSGKRQQAGVLTVVCGPGRIDQAHQPDEYIEIEQLSACVAFMRRLAAELSA